jgi:hypothetical protein
MSTENIDRRAVVDRHRVVTHEATPGSPAQVGNGHFAFGMDFTGLQTVEAHNVLSDWGWHETPLPDHLRIEDYRGREYVMRGHPVRLAGVDPDQPELSNWLSGNPHRLNLGRLGLECMDSSGQRLPDAALLPIRQELDLWTGIATSVFRAQDDEVRVTTVCDPASDAVAFQIESDLMTQGRLRLFLDFPYGDDRNGFEAQVGDYTQPELHQTTLVDQQPEACRFQRQVDAMRYGVFCRWEGDVAIQQPSDEAPAELHIIEASFGGATTRRDATQAVAAMVRDNRLRLIASYRLVGEWIHDEPCYLQVIYSLNGQRHIATVPDRQALVIQPSRRHRWHLQPMRGKQARFTVAFVSGDTAGHPQPFEQVVASAKTHWAQFWNSGGAIDLSASTDPRWRELERRIVLSRYLMAVNEAGNTPPQESGLVNNSWYGRFHIEMHWWHVAHYFPWGKPELATPALQWYAQILPVARQRAELEGCAGARWPKSPSPEGREWPHPIHAQLIWQQPHPIFFAEQAYRADPTRRTLEQWETIIHDSAEFMATYPAPNVQTGCMDLGPNLVVVSENTDPAQTRNPTFELSYWRTGLRLAIQWFQRCGRTPPERWQQVLDRMAPLPVEDGVYVLYQDVPDMWTTFNWEHPAILGALGMLPGDGVDIDTMQRTLDKLLATWLMDRVWGWDFPMMAMCAARLGRSEVALDLLLTDSGKFGFDVHGLARGGPFPYFPTNGGLLYAVAMMAAGWDGAPPVAAPGFPQGWLVRHEQISPTL